MELRYTELYDIPKSYTKYGDRTLSVIVTKILKYVDIKVPYRNSISQ
jgi:hypothetical protein